MIPNAPDCWDSRDREIGLRDQFAKLVATKISGLYEVIPNENDYRIADEIGSMIEAHLDAEDIDD